MTRPIRILYLRDNCEEVDRVIHGLKKETIANKTDIVDTLEHFSSAISERRFDIILANSSLTGLNGSALAIAQKHAPDIPFIYLTETMNEDITAGLDSGLTDCVLKHDLSRLGFTIRRSLRDAEERLRCKRTEEQLKEFTEELMRSNAELQRFAYVASHDLQEPLRRMANFAELLQKKYSEALDETADKYINYIVDGAKRMQRLIQDLLQFSRVSRSEFTFEKVDFNKLVKEILEDYEFEIQRMNAVVTVDRLPEQSANPLYMRQLFQNLISNALKFRRTNPHEIRISAIRKNGVIEYSVRDNGIGIDSKFADRIFVVFYRLHSMEKYSGTGIGLSICKRIVEKHGGNIWVDSKKNQGTTFYFTLPKRR